MKIALGRAENIIGTGENDGFSLSDNKTFICVKLNTFTTQQLIVVHASGYFIQMVKKTAKEKC